MNLSTLILALLLSTGLAPSVIRAEAPPMPTKEQLEEKKELNQHVAIKTPWPQQRGVEAPELWNSIGNLRAAAGESSLQDRQGHRSG